MLYHQQEKHFNIWNFQFETRIKRNQFCLSFMNRFVSNIIKYEFYRYVLSVNSVEERERENRISKNQHETGTNGLLAFENSIAHKRHSWKTHEYIEK